MRALEDYYRQHPNSAQANLLLAYHYLTLGHADAARGRLEAVVQLNPNDRLAAGLLQALDRQGSTPAPTEPRY